jgi:transposase
MPAQSGDEESHCHMSAVNTTSTSEATNADTLSAATEKHWTKATSKEGRHQTGTLVQIRAPAQNRHHGEGQGVGSVANTTSTSEATNTHTLSAATEKQWIKATGEEGRHQTGAPTQNTERHKQHEEA